jgi:hypothetical protein
MGEKRMVHTKQITDHQGQRIEQPRQQAIQCG